MFLQDLERLMMKVMNMGNAESRNLEGRLVYFQNGSPTERKRDSDLADLHHRTFEV